MTVAPFTRVPVTCPACRFPTAVVYFDGEYEALICDHCFYEEWYQPPGTYPELRVKEHPE